MSAPRRPRRTPFVEVAAATERADLAEARCVQMRASLVALVRQLERIGGYTTSEQQAELRVARALLEEFSP